MVKPKEQAPPPEIMKPVTPETPDGVIGDDEQVIELQPVEDVEIKEAPPEVDDQDDAEELVK